MRVSFIAAECEPWAKTGGLADVVDALARALGRNRVAPAIDGEANVYLPRYRGVPLPEARVLARSTLRVADPLSPHGTSEVALIDIAADGYRLRLVDYPAAFDRDGYYGDGAGDFPDNAWRFGLFCRAALEAIRLDGGTDVLHLHDWHAGPALLLRDGPYAGDAALGPAATILTIHNLAYRGWVQPDRVWLLGLGLPPDHGPGGSSRSGGPMTGSPRSGGPMTGSPRSGGPVPASLPPEGLLASSPGAVARPPARRRPAPDPEHGIDLLRVGIERAEVVNTVSPSFAAESLRPEFGMGLDELLAERGEQFLGILNGIDPAVWNPATDADIVARYDRHDLAGKAACRADLLARVGFDASDDGPVLGAVGRLDPQKGFDLLAGAAPELVARGARLIVQANGDPAIADLLRALALAEPRQVAFIDRFDRAMARRIYAGADLFVMPSRFEPSGQGQMIALRYGTPPVVRTTGGLLDSVVDVADDPENGVGFRFGPPDVAALVATCARAMAYRGDSRSAAWTDFVLRGMARDFSWESGSAPAYLAAYARALALRTVPLAG